MTRSDLTDIEVFVHHETKLALLVSTDGDHSHAVWVPKSACEFNPSVSDLQGVLTLSEGLAIEKELV